MRRIMASDDNGGMRTDTNTAPPLAAAHTDHLAVIHASGADAASFLQGQLSNDFLLLPTNQWQLAAYCSPKGRMLASFWGGKLAADTAHQEIVLVLSKDIAAATLKRLSMFVMRAKVKLVEAPDMLPDLFDNHGLSNWANNEVQRGIARITAPLVDLFVPQMLNYESVGGVSFKKGCYPGQEVIARSQFRGAIKRRTYLVEIADNRTSTTAPAAVGQAVFTTEAEEAVGIVLQIDKNLALICIQTHSANADLRLGNPNGVPITMRQLPYPLLEDL